MEDIQDGPIFVDVTEDEPAEVCVEFVHHSDEQIAAENNEETEYQMDVEVTGEPSILKIQQRRVRCPECNRYTAENEEKMQRHIRKVHRGENPFQCVMCEYSTYNNSVFEEHLRVHQGIKPFKCSKCPYRSVSKKNTKKHELIHRPNNPLKCSHCDFIARHSRSLLSHLRKHGLGDDSEDVIKCLYCENSFKLTEFEMHRKTKEECKRCKFTACSRSLLGQHMTKVHGLEKKRRYQDAAFTCAICSWSSRNRPRILLHIIHHPNQIIDESELDVTVLKKHGILS